MAAISSNGTGGGNWSAIACWAGGAVPGAGDTVTIVAGDTVVLETDTADLAGLTITGTLVGSTAAGTYTLTCSGDIGGAGTWNIGTSETPLPSNVKHIIDFDGTANNIEGAAGLTINWYCDEPVNKYINLSAVEAIGQTVLSVDTDVTADWSPGDDVYICDITGDVEAEARTIAALGITSTTIEITAGLTAQKETGAFVVLRSRNIKVYNTTGNIFNSLRNSVIGAELSGGLYAFNACYSNTIAGAISGCTRGLQTSYSNTVSGTISGCSFGLNQSYYNTVSGTISGCTYGLNACYSNTVSGTISGCSFGLHDCYSNTVSGTISGGSFGLSGSYSNTVSGTISGCTIGLDTSYSNTISGDLTNCTTGLYRSYFNTLYGVDFTGVTTENSGYNEMLQSPLYSYDASYDHNDVTGAFKAWSEGGIVTSSTTSPPTGYTVWYQHACENASAYAFRQEAISLYPGQTLTVNGVMRISGAEDLSANAPTFEIIDASADPLWGAGGVALATSTIPVSDGSETGWQTMPQLTYKNTTTIMKPVMIRAKASHATADVDEAWEVLESSGGGIPQGLHNIESGVIA